MDGNFVVRSHQVDFRKDGTAEKLVGVIVDMVDEVAVGNGAGIEGSMIAAGAPAFVFLGHDVEGGRPGALGSASCAYSQQGVELCFGDSHSVRC
jgi:hypothetical protein